jgi:hypothetical protein
MAEADRILPILRRRLNALHGGVAAPEVVPAHFLQDASLYGAITLALDSAARQATPVLPMGSTERRL